MTPISRRQLITGVAAAASTASFMGSTFAQPAGRPITLVVPTPAGGTTDIAARMLAEPLGKILGTSVVVDNRGGANGNIAGQQVARGAADGTSLLVQYSGYQSITPLLQPVAGFDPGKDLTPIANLIDAPQLMVVRSNFPATTFAEFLKYAKAGKLRALMVTGRTRLAALPDVSTATEQRVPLVASSWFAVFGPNGMPTDTLTRISSVIKQVVESDNFRKRAEEQGAKALFLRAPTWANWPARSATRGAALCR